MRNEELRGTSCRLYSRFAKRNISHTKYISHRQIYRTVGISLHEVNFTIWRSPETCNLPFSTCNLISARSAPQFLIPNSSLLILKSSLPKQGAFILVFSSLCITCVKDVMCLVASGFTEAFIIYSLNIGVLMRFS